MLVRAAEVSPAEGGKGSEGVLGLFLWPGLP